MAEKYSFFPDVEYTTFDWAKYFGSFIGNGVFPNPSTGLQVIANNDMTVTVKAGKAWIDGYFYRNESDLIIPIENADGVLKRIDNIVVQLDRPKNKITAKVVKGAFSSSPIAPSVLRTADYYDLKVAQISLNAGAISIVQSNITDTRLDSAVCGIVTQTVTTIDTATLYAQIQADLAGFKTNEQADFMIWFNSIKDILDANTAGNLLNLINAHKADTALHVTTLTHTKTATAHNLVGTLPTTGIVSANFQATADFLANDTFSVNSTVYTAKPNGEEPALPDKAFIAGDLVNVTIDIGGKKLGFKLGGGGGLPKTWQEEITANARENIIKDDAIVYQEFGDLLSAPHVLTSIAPYYIYGNNSSLTQISGDGRYFISNGEIFKINSENDTYHKLSNPAVPFGSTVCYAISSDGSIIAGLDSSTCKIKWYLKNTNDEYIKQTDVSSFSVDYGPNNYHQHNFLFTTNDTLLISYCYTPSGSSERFAFAAVNFKDRTKPKTVLDHSGSTWQDAAIDYTGTIIISVDRYSPAKLYIYKSNDGGVSNYVETGKCLADSNKATNIVSPKLDMAIEGRSNTDVNQSEFVRLDINGVPTLTGVLANLNDLTGSYSLYDPTGNYFLSVKGGAKTTQVYSTQTIPYVNQTPLATFPFRIAGMKCMAANGQFAIANDENDVSCVIRLVKKSYVQKLDSVYSQSILSKNKTLKTGIGIALKSAQIGQPCKVNLLPPINNNLGGIY